jgi:hypothetical protein
MIVKRNSNLYCKKDTCFLCPSLTAFLFPYTGIQP